MSYGNRTERAWHLDAEAAEPIVRRAVEAGVTLFDTADTYDAGASEEVTGRLLARLFSRRDEYVLATKVFFPMGPGSNDGGLSRKHILSALAHPLAYDAALYGQPPTSRLAKVAQPTLVVTGGGTGGRRTASRTSASSNRPQTRSRTPSRTPSG